MDLLYLVKNFNNFLKINIFWNLYILYTIISIFKNEKHKRYRILCF